MKVIYLILVSLIYVSCSQEPSNPGLCALSCQGSIIGPNEARIEPVFQPEAIFCTPSLAEQPMPEPLLVQFSVTDVANDPIRGGERIIPLPSVSFEPLVNGARSPLQEHNPNVEINNGVFTPVRYKGILTPISNWCTDTCGIAAVEVVPVCPAVGQSSSIAIGIHSGAAFSEVVSVSIETAVRDDN